jgi:hypothetical protein
VPLGDCTKARVVGAPRGLPPWFRLPFVGQSVPDPFGAASRLGAKHRGQGPASTLLAWRGLLPICLAVATPTPRERGSGASPRPFLGAQGALACWTGLRWPRDGVVAGVRRRRRSVFPFLCSGGLRPPSP